MATFGEIKTRVATETNRADLTSEIATAVLDAVDAYAHYNFAFNEERNTVATVADTVTVTVPTGLQRETGVWIDVSGSDYQLRKRSLEAIEGLQASTDTAGQPIYYAYHDGTFRLWPTPSSAWTLTVVGIYDTSALAADGDSNDLTADRAGARLLAAWARQYIAENLTYDIEMAATADKARQEAENLLTTRANNKQATGLVRPCL